MNYPIVDKIYTIQLTRASSLTPQRVTYKAPGGSDNPELMIINHLWTRTFVDRLDMILPEAEINERFRESITDIGMTVLC